MNQANIPPELAAALDLLRQAYQLSTAYQAHPTPEALNRLRLALEALQRQLEGLEWPRLSPPTAKAQVLIVEDEADTAEMLAEMLALQGYQIKKFYRAQAAIEYLREHHPDAVVLDIMMPETSGLTVLQFLRQHPRLRQVPVVVVSAKSLPSDIQTALEAGAQAYLVKPVTFNDLVDTVERLLKR